MISIHLHGAAEHLLFALLVLLMAGTPIVAYITGRRDGREATDDAWREFLEYGALDDEDGVS